MKLKGISWFEQNLEKVFACLFFAALLVVLALQFVGKESTVKVDKADVPLNTAWESVASKARQTGQKLAANTAPEGDTGAATRQIVEFSERFKGPVSPAAELAVAIGETSSVGMPSVRIATPVAPLPEIRIPPTTDPVAVAHLTLVHPAEAEVPEIAAVLPAAMPFDKAGVTVEAEFSGEQVRRIMTTDPDGQGPIRPMPGHWLENLQILDVEMLREELRPDGTWGNATLIVPLPGRMSLREELGKPIPGAAHLKELARLATDAADLVRRPTYYQSWLGEKWLPPSERRDNDRRLAELAGLGDDVRRLRDTAQRLSDNIRNVDDQLSRLGPGGAQPPGERPRPSPPPNPGGGGKSAPGPGGAPPRTDPGRPDPSDARRRQLEQQRDRLQRDLDVVVSRLRAMNQDVSMFVAGEAAPDAPTVAATFEPPLLENPSVKVWAHDVSVERGRTYRYQLRVVLNNPMFGQGNVMVPEQQQWASAPVVRSEPSAWSEPVKVDDESYFFIVGASAADARVNRLASARAELFVFKWGRWRKADTSLEPGDRLEATVKYPDFSVLLAGGAPGDGLVPIAGQPGRRDPTQPPPPSPPPSTSPTDTRTPPGSVPVAPERDRREPVRPGQPDGVDVRGQKLPTLSADIKVDAIFLNVGSAPAMPGSTAASAIVFLRDAMGRVITRTTSADQSSGLLARLRRSAEDGEGDLRPADAQRPDEPRQPVRPVRPEPEPGGKSPGGGGGGGGGA